MQIGPNSQSKEENARAMDSEKSCAHLHVICIVFTCDQFHVQMRNPPSPVFPTQGPLSHCPHHSPQPLAPTTNLSILFLLPTGVPRSPTFTPSRTHLPNTQNRFLGSYPPVQEGHPCLSPPALSRAGTADSKHASQQIPAPFSLVINGAALPMNLPLILRKL